MTLYDLHSHSTASDGALNPGELVRRAAEKGVSALALTDHDGVAGLSEAAQAALEAGIQLIPGVELSTTWNRQCFHVVGLNIEPGASELVQGMAKLAEIRSERAREIGRRLIKLGFAEAYDTAMALAGTAMVTRSHFARALTQLGHTADEKAAFERFLIQGKMAYVGTEWADVRDAVSWIRQAGGVAILAHPMRYKLTGTKLRAFLDTFIEAGGEGIEVVCGNSTPDQIRDCAELARRFSLLASTGSDFHSPDQCWVELGRLRPLPVDMTPVWERWS